MKAHKLHIEDREARSAKVAADGIWKEMRKR
jgi:hypothetical protein